MIKSCPVRVKAAGESDGLEEGIFEAIVSVFGNVDSYGDRVNKGAFEATLAEWAESGSPIPVYWSHRMDDPDFNIGEVLEAKETDAGLWVKARLDLEDAKAAKVYKLLKGRRVTQFSFAYDVVRYSITKGTEGQRDIWELEELKLYEVGPTPIGANQETELLEVKSITDKLLQETKAGRVISTKNEGVLKAAHDAIGAVLASLDDTETEKANLLEPDKDDEPDQAKSDDPTSRSLASVLLSIAQTESA